MSVNVLEQKAVQVLKSSDSNADVPAGQYLASAAAEWSIADSEGNAFTVPGGQSTQAFPNGVSSVLYGNAPTPTSWSKGAIQNDGTLKSPLGLIKDGENWIAGNASGKFLSTSNGASWTEYLDLAGAATEDDAPQLIDYKVFADGNGTGSRTIELASSPDAGDLLLFAVTGRGPYSGKSFSSFTGFTEIYDYQNSNGTYVTLAVYYKIATGGETSITHYFSGNEYEGYIYRIKNVKQSAGVLTFRSGFNSQDNTYTAPAVTQVQPNSLVLTGAGSTSNQSITGLLPPEGFELIDVSTGNTGLGTDATVVAAKYVYPATAKVGTVDPSPWTNLGQGGQRQSYTIALDPAVAPVPITCFYKDGADLIAFNPAESAFGRASSASTAWDYSASSLTVDSSALPELINTAQISWNNTGTGVDGSGTTFTSWPTGVQAGHEAFLFWSRNPNIGENSGYTRTYQPRGYEKVYEYQNWGGMTLMRKVLTDADISEGIPRHPNPSSTSYYYAMGVLVYKNVGAYSMVRFTDNQTNLWDAPAFNVNENDTVWLGLNSRDYINGFTQQATGYTQRIFANVDSSYESPIWMASKQITATGSEDPSSIITSNSIGASFWRFIVSPKTSFDFKGIVETDTGFFAFGNDLAISADGDAWTVYSAPFAGINKGSFQDGKYVLVGNAGAVATSSNGISWTIGFSGTASNIVGLSYDRNLYYAYLSNGRVISSADGSIWSPVGTTENSAVAVAEPEVLWSKTQNISNHFEYTMSLDDELKEGDLLIASYGTSEVGVRYEIELLEAGWRELSQIINDSDGGTGFYWRKTWYKFVGPEVDSGVTLRSYRDYNYVSTNITDTRQGTLAVVAFRGISTTSQFVHTTVVANTNMHRPALTYDKPYKYLVISHSLNGYSNNPSLLYSTWTGFTDLSYVNAGNGSVTLAVKDMPQGGTVTQENWVNNSGTVVDNVQFSSIAIAIPTGEASGGDSGPAVVSQAAAYPYILGGRNDGYTHVVSALGDASQDLSSAPYPLDSFALLGNVGSRIVAFMGTGRAAYVGNSSEYLSLTPIGGVRNASS